MSSTLSSQTRVKTGPAERHVSDLIVGSTFRMSGEAYRLLAKYPSSARVLPLKLTRVHLPNGREFDRRAKAFYVSLGAVVEEVFG